MLSAIYFFTLASLCAKFNTLWGILASFPPAWIAFLVTWSHLMAEKRRLVLDADAELRQAVTEASDELQKSEQSLWEATEQLLKNDILCHFI